MLAADTLCCPSPAIRVGLYFQGIVGDAVSLGGSRERACGGVGGVVTLKEELRECMDVELVVGPERLALPGAVSLLLLEEGEVAAVWKETDRDPGVVHNPSP